MLERRLKEKGNVQRALYRFRQNLLSLVGLSLILLLALMAALAPIISPYPDDVTGKIHLEKMYQAPSFKHLFGTDEAGRDVLSQVIFGARISLTLGFIVLTVAVGVGVPLGLCAGYLGGWVEAIIR